MYDCLDRSEEDPYTDSRTSHSPVDLSKLPPCITKDSSKPGFKFSGSETGCLAIGYKGWCSPGGCARVEFLVSVGPIRTPEAL